jgi:hypothetical protein
MLVPATIISDPLSEMLTGDIGCGEGWRIVHSPFYRLERQVLWKKVHFINNTTRSQGGGTYTVTQGIEKTKSETRWQETGTDISAEAGVSIKGVEAKVTAALSKS